MKARNYCAFLAVGLVLFALAWSFRLKRRPTWRRKPVCRSKLMLSLGAGAVFRLLTPLPRRSPGSYCHYRCDHQLLSGAAHPLT